MADEVKDQSLEQKPTDQAAANASLWDDEVQSDAGEKPVEGKPELDADGLPVDNAARSSLGRKLTRYEQQMAEMRDTMNRMNEMLMRQSEERYTPPASSPEHEDDLDDQVVTTFRDVKKLQRIEQDKEIKKQMAYQGVYANQIAQRPFRAKDTPADIHEEIRRELLETNPAQYRKVTMDPMRDAEINYGLAKAKVLERRYSELTQRPNVRGDRPSSPTGVTATTRTAAAPVITEKLDDVSEKFVRAMGAKPEDEWVQNSIKRKDL
jgi:hypothetical protein